MGPYQYVVTRIDGDYAHLRRTDADIDDDLLVAMALLPPETDEGSRLIFENLSYRMG